MKRAFFILALSALWVKADTLEAVLTRMDQAAKTFKSMSANVHRTDYSSVLDETNVEDGTFKMSKKSKNNVVLLVEFTGRDERKLGVADGKAKMYHPKAKSVEVYETKQFSKSADELLLIGFGTSRAELEKKFSIKLGGSETVGATKATRIDLTPKSKEEKNFFDTIQLWIPEDKGNPIQDKFLSGKNYNLLQFSSEKINPQLPDKEFELNLPADVKEIHAGK